MHFDPDRLKVLAGINSQSDYRYKKLNEMEAKIVLSPEDEEEQAMVDQLTVDLAPEEVEVETLPGMAAGVPGAPGSDEVSAPEEEGAAAAGVEEMPPAEDLEAELEAPAEEEPAVEDPLEERLRRIIRTEVRAIVSEEISKRDVRQIERARKTRSVADAMGFTSTTTRPSDTGWSPTLGFAGPGFKK